jgi:hypothetical protein
LIANVNHSGRWPGATVFIRTYRERRLAQDDETGRTKAIPELIEIENTVRER